MVRDTNSTNDYDNKHILGGIMKTGVEIYGLLFAFAFSVITITQLVGITFSYKSANETSSLIVEIIEVHDGLNTNAIKEINEIKNNNPDLEIDIDHSIINNNYIYTINTAKEYKIPLLKLSFEVKAKKISKRINQ